MLTPLVPLTVAFLTGILLGTSLQCPGWVPFLLGIASAAIAWRWRARACAGVLPLLVLWMCLGMMRMIIWQTHPGARLGDVLQEEPQRVRLHGIVSDDPIVLATPREPAMDACVVQLLHVQRGGAWPHHLRGSPSANGPDRGQLASSERPQVVGWQPIAGRVRATLQDPIAQLAYGDEVLMEGRWSRVPAPSNPGQYDWQAALARQGIHGLLRVRPSDGVVVLRHRQGFPWIAAVLQLRRRWERLLQTTAEAREAGLLRSFLLGQRVALDEELNEAFVETGTIHLLVVSGFNVGLVALLLEALLRISGTPWRMRLLLLAISLGAYCVLTGLQPPVARATLMAWLVLGALALDRVISWFNTLAAAALVMLWINPTQLFDPGFQLSFGAVLSLLVLTPRWNAWAIAHLPWMHPAWLRRYVALSVSATAAIWVGLSPILAWYFHLVSPVSIVANLLIAPLASALISVGTGLLLLSSVIETALQGGMGVLTLLVQATIRCVVWCHAIPGGYWYVGHPSPWFLVGYYGLLALALLRARLRLTAGGACLAWLAGLTIWCWSLVGIQLAESRWLRVDILDVGHGDSIVVRTPGGHTIVVDAGTEDAGRFRVVPFLRFAGITTVDALVLTHTDADHIGGAIPLLQQVRVNRLLTNGARDHTRAARTVRQLAASQGAQETAVTAGMRLLGDPEVTIEVLHPPRGLVPGSAPESNDNSVVLSMTKGSVSVLLCGDIEEAGLPWLMGQGAAVRSTVLKVPHHGSRLGAVGERFFERVAPQIAILSVGRLHHLPAPDTVRALARTGARLYSTREHGALSLRTDGVRLEIRTFKR